MPDGMDDQGREDGLGQLREQGVRIRTVASTAAQATNTDTGVLAPAPSLTAVPDMPPAATMPP